MQKRFTVDRLTDIENELLKRSLEAASDGDFARGLRLVDRYYRIYNREPSVLSRIAT